MFAEIREYGNSALFSYSEPGPTDFALEISTTKDMFVRVVPVICTCCWTSEILLQWHV